MDWKEFLKPDWRKIAFIITFCFVGISLVWELGLLFGVFTFVIIIIIFWLFLKIENIDLWETLKRGRNTYIPEIEERLKKEEKESEGLRIETYLKRKKIESERKK